ncbi:hypothetical protein ACFVIZ_14680 [Streptomyces anulatus]|uniref:hypothetical protein n=1 Tax=Streptomyces anulatus TaxID=1892 RepID=UPI00363E67E5
MPWASIRAQQSRAEETRSAPAGRRQSPRGPRPTEKAYSPRHAHHATHGHCYSADQLITLAALEADGRLSHGRRVLVLASSARS